MVDHFKVVVVFLCFPKIVRRSIAKLGWIEVSCITEITTKIAWRIELSQHIWTSYPQKLILNNFLSTTLTIIRKLRTKPIVLTIWSQHCWTTLKCGQFFATGTLQQICAGFEGLYRSSELIVMIKGRRWGEGGEGDWGEGFDLRSADRKALLEWEAIRVTDVLGSADIRLHHVLL